MTLLQLLPDIETLTRVEKLRLIQLLAQELAEREESPPVPVNQSYPVWSPDQAFSAAEAMLKALLITARCSAAP